MGINNFRILFFVVLCVGMLGGIADANNPMPDPYFDPSDPPTRGGGSGWGFIILIVVGVIVWNIFSQLTKTPREKALAQEVRDRKERDEKSRENLKQRIVRSAKAKPIRKSDFRSKTAKPIRKVNSRSKNEEGRKEFPRIIEDDRPGSVFTCEGCNRDFIGEKFPRIPGGHLMFGGSSDERAVGSAQVDRRGRSQFCWECENTMSPQNAPESENHGSAKCPNCGVHLIVRLNCFNKQAINCQKLFMQCGRCADLRVQELCLEDWWLEGVQVVSWDSDEDQNERMRIGSIYYPWSGNKFVGLIYAKGTPGSDRPVCDELGIPIGAPQTKPVPGKGFYFDWKGKKFQEYEWRSYGPFVADLDDTEVGLYKPRGPTIFNAADYLVGTTWAES